MAETYFKLVIAHKRTCNPENTGVKMVPENLREEVMALLAADGRDADGNKVE